MHDDVRNRQEMAPSAKDPPEERFVNWDRLETLFLEALELSGEARAARLAAEPDQARRSEVAAMLAAHDGDELEIERRLLAIEGADELAGERVGPYRLVAQIGRGGMGEVYLARRDDDLYEREVAIKLVHIGPRASLRERFARERAILARLNHPNIATLYDGGVADDGRPFLVMEYVDGVPITDYCDDGRLGLRARIDLFLTVCEAVHAAHAALIIHRDLKASNILVTHEGAPKLLDFGIAKLLEDEDAGQTMVLDRVLTPEHAAPEQIRGDAPTTATDVYGLGVLLCELLVGERPIRFPTQSPVEIDRIAREVEPRAPSALLADLQPAARDRAAQLRDLPTAGLRGRLGGDLDAICLKALRKEPEQRYAGAAELAADLRRHLRSRPVHAVRGNRTYFARKFVRRHRASLALSATALVVLAGFLTVTLRQSVEVRAQRDLARTESARAERVLDRLVDLFESTGPQAAGETDFMDVAAFLERGEETAELLAGDPAAQSQMNAVLADIYANRGQLGRAIHLLSETRRTQTNQLVLLRVEHDIAVMRNRYEGPEVGVPLLRASVERQRDALGPDHPDVLQAQIDLGYRLEDAVEAHPLLLGVLEQLESPATEAEERRRAAALNALANVEMQRSDYAIARTRLEEADSLLARSLPPGAGTRIAVRHNLAAVYTQLGLWERAEPVQRNLLASRRRTFGDSSDLTANELESHAVTLAHLGRHREAGEEFAEALSIFEATLAPDHWRVANGARNVGQLLSLQARYEEALPWLDRAIAITIAGGSPALYLRGQRALVWLGSGRTDEAQRELQEVLLGLEASQSRPDYIADARVWLGIAWLGSGDPDRAETGFALALRQREQVHGVAHPKVAEAASGLALARGELDRAAFEAYRAWGLAHPLLLDRIEVASP